MTLLVRGDKLTQATRSAVLSAYGYRWTRENEQRARQWLAGIGTPTVDPVTDAQWLRAHAFYVNKDGRLTLGRRRAEPAFLASERS